MARWLVVAVLEALGFGLLWHGQRSGDDLISALGAGLVICVTALFGLHLLTDALARRRARDKPPERREPQLFDPTGALLLTNEVGLAPLLLTREVGADCVEETPDSADPRTDPDVASGVDV